MTDFEGLKAVVTGGASGIGLAAARQLSARGAAVAVLDLRADGLPAGLTGFRCDVSDDGEVRAAIDAAATALGGIDVLVNNAGIGAQGDVAANDDAEWHRVLDVNVVGMARVSRAALPHLRGSSSAAIVNTCSIAAWAGLPNRALYSASKGAVLALTLAMATDHLPDEIRVNCVCPGTADTRGWAGCSTRPPIRLPSGRRSKRASRWAGSSARTRWPTRSPTSPARFRVRRPEPTWPWTAECTACARAVRCSTRKRLASRRMRCRRSSRSPRRSPRSR